MHVDQKHSIFALLRIGALVFGFSSTLIVYFTSRPLNVFYLLYAWIILPWIVRLFFITAPKLFKKHSRSDLKVVDWINQQGMGGVKLDFFALKIATLQFSIIYMLTGLATLFVSAMFSDFYFCWASSFDLKSDDVARFFRLIELPWSSVHEWLNFDIISSSRFNQLSGAYSNPTATVASANWIGFIGTATAFYGILPRLVEFGYIQMKQKLRPVDSNAALMESEAP